MALTKTGLELRDEINYVLTATYFPTICIRGNTVMITRMESVKTAWLNSKVGTFLYLIPGTITVHLDTLVTYLLVHSLLTSASLYTIANVVTTHNTGLALIGQSRWLTAEDVRDSKLAS